MQLQKKDTILTFGHASARLSYNSKYNWIYSDWIGMHSLVTIQKAKGVVLEWFRETGATKYITDNSNVVGGWDTANDWLADVWTPKAVEAGMRYVAHIHAPGIYGKLSMKALQPRIENLITIQMFDDLSDAEDWLRSV